MDSNDLIRLRPLVNNPVWDQFMVYLTNKKSEAHTSLETCAEVRLKAIQAEISVYNDLLTLRKTVNNIKSSGDTKTQF